MDDGNYTDNYVFPMAEVLSDIEKEITSDKKYQAEILLAYIKAISITNLDILEKLNESIRAKWSWDDGYKELKEDYRKGVRNVIDKLYAEIEANQSILLDSLLLRKKTK